MRLKSMVLLVAILPLLLALAAVVGVVGAQLQQLAGTQKEAVAAILNQARRDELRHLVHTSVRAISTRFPAGANDPKARREALEYLRSLTSDDSYYFVYDIAGTCLLDAGEPINEAKNCWNLRDDQGVMVVQRLIGQGLGRGGFLEHIWHRPSTQLPEPKLSYAELMPGWDWVVGTGLYQDKLRQADEAIKRSTDEAVGDTRDLILLIASLALVAVGAGGLLLNVHEQRKANTKLRQMHHRAERAAHDTRKTVARELHDSVVQSIAASKMGLESAAVMFERGNEAATGALREGLQNLGEVMREVRRISHGLASMTLEDLGLKAALEETVRKLGEHTPMAVTLSIDELPPMAPEVAHDLLQCARQALANAEKHAEATRAELTLAFDEDRGLTLQVSDNGKGFDVAGVMRQPREGLGLTSMRERIEMLGGRFSIRSKPGAGATVVTAIVPPKALQARPAGDEGP